MYELNDFIKDMESITNNTEDHNLIIKKAKPALKKLLRNKNFNPIISDKPRENSRYYRYLIYSDKNNKFFIFAMLWPPNQEAQVHDHNKTWGIEGVYKGRLRVKNFIQMPDEEKTRLKILSQFILNSCEIGDVTEKLNIHKVENLDKESITIHVYGENLIKTKVYDKINDNDEYSIKEQNLSIDN